MPDFSTNDLVVPARHHYPVTFSDTVNITDALGFTGQRQPRALYCNAAGNIAVVDGGDRVQVYTVTAGQVLTFRAKRINATNTTVTAGSVVAWF